MIIEWVKTPGFLGTQVSAADPLPVNVVASSAGSDATAANQATEITSLQLLDDVIVADDSPFTPAVTKLSMAGFTFDNVGPDSIDEGDAGAARMSANRNIFINIRDAAGNERGWNIDVNGAGAVKGAGTAGTADTGVQTIQGIAAMVPVQTKTPFVTVTTQFTRPNDTTAYTAEDCISDSTSAPTAFTLTGAARASGGAGIITDAVIGMSTKAGTPLQGEVWIFDQSFTNVNDNAAFSLSDADRDKLVGIIPFTCNSNGGLNYSAAVTGLNIGFTCIGTANLRFMVKAINAYTPAALEVLTVRLKIMQVD